MDTRRPGIDTREKYVALTTYRADGSMVTTPVWFVDGPHVLRVITDADAGKTGRIRADQHVLVAACDMRGRVTGPHLPGIASIDDDQTSIDGLRRAVEDKYRLAAGFMRVQSRLGRETERVQLRITLGDDPA